MLLFHKDGVSQAPIKQKKEIVDAKCHAKMKLVLVLFLFILNPKLY